MARDDPIPCRPATSCGRLEPTVYTKQGAPDVMIKVLPSSRAPARLSIPKPSHHGFKGDDAWSPVSNNAPVEPSTTRHPSRPRQRQSPSSQSNPLQPSFDQTEQAHSDDRPRPSSTWRSRVSLQMATMSSSFAREASGLCDKLLIAAERGNRHAVYLLLHQNIDRDRCRGMAGFTPLHHAAARGHLDVLQVLLDFGWPVDVRNDVEETALHLASFNGWTAIVECLLDRGACVNALNAEGETALFYAARKGHKRIVRLLIRRECDLTIANRYGDVAEDEALGDEKTLTEFHVGKEDSLRLYCHRTLSSDSSSPRLVQELDLQQRIRELILSFLDLKSLCRASMVAYRWHRAADNPSLWRRLGVSRWELLLGTTMGIGTVPAMRFLVPPKHECSKRESGRPISCDSGRNAMFSKHSIILGHHHRNRGQGSRRPHTARLNPI